MSGIVGKVEQKLNDKLNKDAQPGNQVEGKADGDVNDSECILCSSPSFPAGRPKLLVHRAL